MGRRRYSSRFGQRSKIGFLVNVERFSRNMEFARLPAWIRHHSSHLVVRVEVLPSPLVQVVVVATVDLVVGYSIRFSGCYPTATAYSSPRFDLLVVVSLQGDSVARVPRPILLAGERRRRGHRPTVSHPG